MDLIRGVTRRAAIKDMGKAGLAIVVFGAACTDEAGRTTSTLATTAADGNNSSSQPSSSTTEQQPAATSLADLTRWERVNMGFVSAYILYRKGEAALVDTGQSGSEGDIEGTLDSVGMGWDAVTSVILTHRHPDHIGSVEAVARLARNSNVYIGEGDLAAIPPLSSDEGTQGPVSVREGDNVFGLEVIDTPGHTPGSISVLDPAAGILVVGDAMNTRSGRLASASADPQFTEDLALADESVRRLTGFDYEVVLVGHGEPIVSGGSEAVSALAGDLGA